MYKSMMVIGLMALLTGVLVHAQERGAATQAAPATTATTATTATPPAAAVPPATAPAAAPAYKAKSPKLNRAQLDALLATPDQILIIDVRRPDELTKNGGFPVYLSIQAKELEKSLYPHGSHPDYRIEPCGTRWCSGRSVVQQVFQSGRRGGRTGLRG